MLYLKEMEKVFKNHRRTLTEKYRRMERIIDYLACNPLASRYEIAQSVKASPTTTQEALDELVIAKRVEQLQELRKVTGRPRVYWRLKG